jgi:hypothetical protein
MEDLNDVEEGESGGTGVDLTAVEAARHRGGREGGAGARCGPDGGGAGHREGVGARYGPGGGR